jgi:2-phosphosulfolactate phosphatase
MADYHGKPGTSVLPITLDVVSTPTELMAALREHAVAVCAVIDVVRATTTLTVFGERKGASVLLAPDIAGARHLVTLYPDMLLAGESQGRQPLGFDYGNSPSIFIRAEVAGARLIFATTNGTRVLRACQDLGAPSILAACLRNAGAIARELASQPDGSTIMLVCAGRGDRVAIDDLYTAGIIVTQIEQEMARQQRSLTLTEEANIARDLTKIAGDPFDVLRRSDAGRAIIDIGLENDLSVCAAVDVTEIVPRVQLQDDGELVVVYDPVATF